MEGFIETTPLLSWYDFSEAPDGQTYVNCGPRDARDEDEMPEIANTADMAEILTPMLSSAGYSSEITFDEHMPYTRVLVRAHIRVPHHHFIKANGYMSISDDSIDVPRTYMKIIHP